MEISPIRLALLLLYSFVFGMAAGVLNDINRVLRALLGDRRRGARGERLYDKKLPLVGKLSQRKKSRALPVLIFVGDVLLFVFIGCGIVVLNFYLNRGQLRLYSITVVGVGFLAYYFTLGKLVMLVSDYIVFFVRATLAITFHIVSAPFLALFRAVKKIFLRIFGKFRRLLEKRRLVRYNKREEKRMRLLAKNNAKETKEVENEA